MAYATAVIDGEEAALYVRDDVAVEVRDIIPELTGDLLAVISSGRAAEIEQRADERATAFRPLSAFELTVPYRHPRMIWGIGLNYVEHASDLDAVSPTDEPASFIKGDHTIIAPGEPIPLPVQSERVTAEAELGVIIGRECRNVEEADALDYVFGFCTVLDQTAEDILQKNPRFLTRSKNFPGFFSFGPKVVTAAELFAVSGTLADVSVTTLINHEVHRQNVVSNMTFSPEMLISFHSKVMPLYPGDIISTGTPGAVVIRAGDVAGCLIPGIGELSNPVIGAAA
jgi:2-keto-4-pentenoate hydratase/2-oxohepta-3-ene-1,7-dioic acid hydratase in catechol pathway